MSVACAAYTLHTPVRAFTWLFSAHARARFVARSFLRFNNLCDPEPEMFCHVFVLFRPSLSLSLFLYVLLGVKKNVFERARETDFSDYLRREEINSKNRRSG